jgi:hypothetical protein
MSDPMWDNDPEKNELQLAGLPRGYHLHVGC